jgi:putative spermidine/putrescine transport system permease protein
MTAAREANPGWRAGDAPAARIGAWAIVCFLVLPVLIVLPIAVTDRRYLSLPQDGISFQHFANLFTSAAWLGSIAQSLVIALASAAVAVAAGALCAIGCWRIDSRLSAAVRALMLIPIIVPTIVYALGLYRFWIVLGLLDSYLGVIIAHAVTGIPYVVIIVSTALVGFDPRLEQAARSLGASPGQTLRRIILPNILSGIVSSAIFAFIHSWDELVIVLFIASRAVFTLPRRIWDGINDNLDPTMAAVATLLILLTIALLAINALVGSRRRS